MVGEGEHAAARRVPIANTSESPLWTVGGLTVAAEQTVSAQRRPNVTKARVAYALRAVAVFSATGAWLAVPASSPAVALVASAVVAAVWLAALHYVLAAARPSTRALGSMGVAALGSLLGLALVPAVLTLFPIDIGPVSLLLLGGTIFAVELIWQAAVGNLLFPHRSLLIVGAGPGTHELLEELEQLPTSPYEVVGVVAGDAHARDLPPDCPLRGDVSSLAATLNELKPDLVVVEVERDRPAVFKHLLEAAELGFKVVGMPEFYEQAFGRVPVDRLSAAWFMSVLHLYQRPYSRFVKRTFDIVVASLALVVAAPILAAAAALVRITGGPIIYRQVRIGEAGRPFTMYKLRTMRVDAEACGAAVWAVAEDPRTTSIGRLLRRSRIDELPQLWNVLKGEMSIVGPRPERPELMAPLEALVPFWTRRELLKPGITGWAQVSSGYAFDTESARVKLSYDLWYLRHRSLVVDLVICAKTFGRVLSGAGAH